jgi:hypothetical protein
MVNSVAAFSTVTANVPELRRSAFTGSSRIRRSAAIALECDAGKYPKPSMFVMIVDWIDTGMSIFLIMTRMGLRMRESVKNATTNNVS